MVARIRAAMVEKDQGFTLIELLVVIIIIGILAAIAIPVFLNQRKKGVDASIKSDMKNLAAAAETYSADYPTLPEFWNPNATPTPQNASLYNVRNNFAALGFKKSPGNLIYINGGPANGYCIGGSNPNGTGGSLKFFWYDSKAGGILPGSPTAQSDPPPSGAVACANVLNPNPVWYGAL